MKNYKKIDSLAIDFQHPLMKGDTDVLVFGSKNGGGKTSILECCALLILAGIFGQKKFRYFYESSELLDIAHSLVKAGKKRCFVSLAIPLNGPIDISRKDDISIFENKSFSGVALGLGAC
ncbi:MAG: hypothetical protein Q9M50_03810 [Methylococcales bacterium]|nr:hypothetical protein [Methylococcales bacterium]